jgi:hypothetical protein
LQPVRKQYDDRPEHGNHLTRGGAMPTKTASPKNTAAGPNITEDRAAALHWRQHPLFVAAEQHLQHGQEALAAAEAQVTALEAEVERAKGHLHEAMVAQQIGDATEADVVAARATLAETEARLAQAREVADASRGALAILARRRDEAAAQAREQVAATLAAQFATAVDGLAAALRALEERNRRVLRLTALYRANGLEPPAVLGFGEFVHLAPGERLLRSERWIFDYGPPRWKTTLTAWFEKARAAGFAVEPPPAVTHAEILPSGVGGER